MNIQRATAQQRHRSWIAVAMAVIVAATSTPAFAADTRNALRMQAIESARPKQGKALAPKHFTACVGGFADGYPCSNVDLLAFVPLSQFAANNTNSLWGWTDPQTQIEYALIGADNGIVFFDLSVPDHPRYLGKLNSYTGSSVWRDVRVYANHAFVVSDNNGAHGMQVFDLTRLRNVGSIPQTFNEDRHYAGFGIGHTIAITEESGFAFIAGSNTCPAPTATGGLHMIDIRNPLNPVFAGCIATGGYTHEAQCWIYQGPDSAHQGKEICFNSNGTSGRVAIVDVTSKSAPVTLSSNAYAGSRYTHQGWLTEDHRYLLVNDELDETNNGHNARTYVWDVADLDVPVLKGYHQHALPVIDHNLYVHGNYVFESNYEAGLRILRIDNLSTSPPLLTEVAYFDTFPAAQSAQFNGNWNNYRFPRSGIVIASGIDEGFFVLQPRLCVPPATPTAMNAVANGSNRIDLSWTGSGQVGASFQIERAQGGCGGAFQALEADHGTSSFSDMTASGATTYGYRISERNGDVCTSIASACVTAATTGACTAAPLFSGLATAIDSRQAECRVDLNWSAAVPACGGGAQYSVYRDTTPGFVPGAGNRIANAVNGNAFSDFDAVDGVRYHYLVRALDTVSGAEDSNQRSISAWATGPAVPGTFYAGAEPGESGFDDGSAPVLAQGKSSLAPKHAGWHPANDRKRTGTYSFWSTRANNLCASLVSPPIQLQVGMTSSLSFWQAFATQSGIDGGVIEISVDGGTIWTRLTPVAGYPGTISGSETLCGIAPGSGAVTGSNGLNFAQSTVSLAAYAGQTVRLRWLYRSNASTSTSPGGWYVDDISISQAMVPGPCSAKPLSRDFSNGFEDWAR